MPSASSKQHRFMSAVAHNPTFAKKAGVPQSVGKDFAAADKGRKFGRGGRAGINIQNTQHGKIDMPFKSLRRHAGFKGGGEIVIPKKMSNRSRIRMPDMRSSMMPMRPTMPPKMAGGMRAGGKVKTFKRGGNAGKVAALAGILGLGALALRDKKPAPVEDRRVSAGVPTKVEAPEIMPSTRDNDEFYGYDDAVRNAKLMSEDYYGYDDAVRNAKLMSEDYYGYDDAVKKTAEMKPVVQRIPSSVKQRLITNLSFDRRDPFDRSRLSKPNFAKGGFIMKKGKPVLNKKMMGGGRAKYAHGGMHRMPGGKMMEDSAMKKHGVVKYAKGGMPMKDGKPAFMQKKMMGGGMAKYAKGGGIESHGKTRGTVVRMASGGSVSSRADGIAQRGKTKFKTY